MGNETPLLEVRNIFVEVEGKEILKGINLKIPKGETHVLFGPNGCGKSTLVLAIMGAPGYKITDGEILFEGRRINDLPTYERARLGIGLAFQRPPSVRGVKLLKLLEILNGQNYMDSVRELNLETLLERDINLGFSGGESKKAELLQLLVQKPKLVLLDEPESGVDIENLALVGRVISKLLEREGVPLRDRKVSGLIITHTGYVLDYVSAEKGYIMVDGRIICSGNPYDILKEIRKRGFEGCLSCFEREMLHG